MSDTTSPSSSAASSLFETITGRKRKRATPKGCDGRPALNGSKAPTYLTDEDGNIKRLGRRDAKDIPNNALVLRYRGDGRPDPSQLTEDQRKGLEPLPEDWEFVPVFALVAGKRRGQILHQYGLKDLDDTLLELNYDKAFDAWMRASAQDPSVATRDHLLFMVLLHNSATQAAVMSGTEEYFEEGFMNPPSLDSTKALIAALDQYGLRERVVAQSLGIHESSSRHSEKFSLSLHKQATRNLHEFATVAAKLAELDNPTVAQWLAEDFILFDQEALQGDLLSTIRLLSASDIDGRVELYEQWHRAATEYPALAGLITAFRETSMRGGRSDGVRYLDTFIEDYRSGDYETSRVLDVLDDLVKDQFDDVNLGAALRNANYMLRAWPMHELSAGQISTVLTSRQLGDVLYEHVKQELPVPLETVNDVLFSHKIARRCNLPLKEVMSLSGDSLLKPETFQQLVERTAHSGPKENWIPLANTRHVVNLVQEVANDLKHVPIDTVALTAAVMFQDQQPLAGRPRASFEALRDRLGREAADVHLGHKTFAQVAANTPQETPRLRYDIAVGSELGPAPTYGVEWTRQVRAGSPLLGNIDPQHDGGSDTRAAIEAALDAPLPPRGVTLQTVRPDLDAYGAMAVLAARAAGEDLSALEIQARIATIAAADRRADLDTKWAPKPYDPEFIQNPEVVGLSRTIRELDPTDAVVELGNWLRTGELPRSADRVIQERLASQRQMAERFAAQKASGEAAVRGDVVPWIAAVDVAPDVVYSEAPVAVLSKATSEGFKHTIAVHPGFNWRITPELVAALNAHEAELGGTPEWGGPNNGKLLGSPQKGDSRISQEEFRSICARFIG